MLYLIIDMDGKHDQAGDGGLDRGRRARDGHGELLLHLNTSPYQQVTTYIRHTTFILKNDEC